MGRFTPSGLVRSFCGDGGEITLWFPGGDVAAGRVVGPVKRALAAAAYAEIDRYAASHCHPGRGFIDISAMTTFEWEARMVLVRWNIAHRHQASTMDVLTHSWIADMSLRTLGTVLRERLVVHENRTTFETAYSVALSRHTGTIHAERSAQ